MSELKYIELMRWMDPTPVTISLPVSIELHLPTSHFLRGLELVFYAATLPAISNVQGKFSQLHIDRAAVEVFGKLDYEDTPENQRVVFDKWSELASTGKALNVMIEPSPLEAGAHSLEHAANHEIKIRIGIESVMSQLLVGAWTAFEALAEALWVECLNARRRLGFQAMDAEPSQSDDEGERDRKDRVKFSFPAHLLRDKDFDANKMMGTALRDKWDFANRKEAKDAFMKAFRDRKDDIESIFDHESLKWLAALRNVIVHNARIADKDFTKLVRGHSRLKNIKLEEEVSIDGEMAKEFLGAAVEQARSLIAFCDNWLRANPE